ncbi:MAG: hypothetical protein JW984_00285 [Deltaproteobacteria bacterium]|uniref:Uncharacterized protein n=1 Tax=Candidatus Zymogenus saltonus TaxID=2844893 RepID=A0A9D8KDJ4_9DELT|nr:hypothetical protein [Candidatus Zymogenus saltonus]
MGVRPIRNGTGNARGIKGAIFYLVVVSVIAPALSPALKAQTNAAPPFEMTVKAEEIPQGYGLRNVLLMNPGDMERCGLKGGETVRVCNKEESGAKDCVTLTLEYGVGVASGTVMMDTQGLTALRLSPGDRFLMELTFP